MDYKPKQFALLSSLSFLLLAFFNASNQPALADSYEFETLRELAEAPAKKVDLGALRKSPELLAAGAPKVFSQEAEPKWKAAEKQALTVKTSPDGLLVSCKDYSRIYNFKEKLIYDLNPATKTYSSHSLFGDLAFRKAELNNRIFLHQLIGQTMKGQSLKAQSTAGLFDLFFSEAMFGLKLPENNSGYKIQKIK
ncbi:MAG: hypothetical protein K2X27_28710, partial [Candidatus Obscuribacterales bacterium]|nr:hypothetical protein [Candidatus Obscuribacterales bacterium]